MFTWRKESWFIAYESSKITLLLICGDIELCPGPQVQENLTDISKLRGIKLVHRNISGLVSKKDILETLFTNEKFIITLSETHITSVKSELFLILGLQFVHKNRIAEEGEGITMYLSSDLKWKQRTDLETDEIECIWVKVDIFKSKSFLVGCTYRPLDSSSYLRKDFNKNINEMLTKVNNLSMETILLGDTKVNYLVKSSHKEIKELFITHGLHQLVKLPTRVMQEAKSLIDVIMKNTRSNVHHTDVLPLSLSDHDCVMCVRKINHRKMPFRRITCRDYSKYNHTVLARDIENYDWNPVYTETNVNIALDYMEQRLTTIIDRYAPKITKRVKGPRLTYEIKTLMNTKDTVLRKARKTNKECDWSSYKRVKNLCNNKVKQAEQKYRRLVIRKLE